MPVGEGWLAASWKIPCNGSAPKRQQRAAGGPGSGPVSVRTISRSETTYAKRSPRAVRRPWLALSPVPVALGNGWLTFLPSRYYGYDDQGLTMCTLVDCVRSPTRDVFSHTGETGRQAAWPCSRGATACFRYKPEFLYTRIDSLRGAMHHRAVTQVI